MPEYAHGETPSFALFRQLCDRELTPVLSACGFSVGKEIDSGSLYYARNYIRGNWVVFVQYEPREDYMDIRLAATPDAGPIGANLLHIAKKRNVFAGDWSESRGLSLEARFNWWRTKIIEPLLSYLAEVTRPTLH